MHRFLVADAVGYSRGQYLFYAIMLGCYSEKFKAKVLEFDDVIQIVDRNDTTVPDRSFANFVPDW